jgi:CubicO group peptidase (beta-lactamase class C family)
MGTPHQMFEAICGLIAQADPQTIRDELPKLFTATNLDREPLARRIGAFMEWRKRGGFDLVRIEAESTQQLDVEIRFPISQDHWRLRIVLEENGSGLIDEMLMGRAPLPLLTTTKTDQQTAQAYLDYVAHLGQHDLFSGAVLIGRHGKILGTCAAGYASREYGVLNTPETLFNVASLTKSWTAVAVVRLIEQGKLDLETSVAQLGVRDQLELDPRIEIRHLLSHTSGLGDYFGKPFNMTPRDKLRSLDDFLDLATSFEPTFTPGTDWAYSNIGMMLLGKVIAQMSGRSYYEAMSDLVFEPAGMKTAFFPHLDEVHLGCANGYGQRWTEDGPVTINALHSWAIRGAADGCAFASLQDIWAFVEAFQNGKLVSPEMARVMTSAKPELGALDYGYGFALLPERAVVGHSGGLVGASANLDMTNDPDGWTVIVLANDLSMRTPVIKARQMIGVTMQERDEAQTNMPRAGLTAR